MPISGSYSRHRGQSSPVAPLMVVVLCVVGVVSGGCVSMKSVQDAPLTLGVPYVFGAPRDEVLSAAREVLVDAGLPVAEEYNVNDSVSVLIGESDFSLLAYGHFVRLTVESHSDGTTSVRVFAKRKDGADKGYYTDEIISGIKHALK